MQDFDYQEALQKLDALLKKVEDPSTGLGEIDRYISESDALIKDCRKYLRSVREKLENHGDEKDL